MTTKKKSVRHQLTVLIDRLMLDIDRLDVMPFDSTTFSMPTSTSSLGVELEYRLATKHLINLISALTKGDKIKAVRHMHKLSYAIRSTANDSPFKVNDIVDVIRTPRGWNMGYTAKITEVYKRSTGTYAYTAQVIENGQYTFSIDIVHTNDARLA